MEVTVAAGSLGIAKVAGGLISSLPSVWGAYNAAEDHLQSMLVSLESLKIVTTSLGHTVPTEITGVEDKDDLNRVLKSTLKQCEKLVKSLNQQVETLQRLDGTMSFWRKARYVWKLDDLLRVERQLDKHTNLLNLILTTIQRTTKEPILSSTAQSVPVRKPQPGIDSTEPRSPRSVLPQRRRSSTSMRRYRSFDEFESETPAFISQQAERSTNPTTQYRTPLLPRFELVHHQKTSDSPGDLAEDDSPGYHRSQSIQICQQEQEGLLYSSHYDTPSLPSIRSMPPTTAPQYVQGGPVFGGHPQNVRFTGFLRGHADHIHHVAFSPDGSLLASACDDSSVKLWNAVEGTVFHSLQHGLRMRRVKFSEDGRLLIALPVDTRLAWLWCVKTGSQLACVDMDVCSGVQLLERALDISRDAELLTVSSKESRSSAGLPADLWFCTRLMDFLPDPGHLCLFQGAQFKIWKYPAGRRGQPEGPNSAQISLQNPFVTLGLDSFITWPIFSDDGLLSAYQARHGGIEIRRTVDWSLQQTLKGHQRTVFQFCFSPDGKQLASCSESDRAQEVKDWSIRLWDTSTGQQLLHLDHHEQSSHALMFSKDGRYLLSASWGLIMVWDVVSGRSNCIRRIHTATQYAGGFALSGDGRYMAAVVADTAIKVWDFEKDIIGYTPSTGGARPDVDGSCFCAFEHFQPHAYGGRCDTCLYGGWEHGGWRNSVDFAEGGRAK